MNLFKKFRIIIIIIILLFINILPLNYTYAEEITNSNSKENISNPNLTTYSPIALLIERSTGQILYNKNGFSKTYNASTTKLLTAILTVENTNLNDIATVSKTAVNAVPINYTNSNIQFGEKLSIDSLLHLLLIPSANDAANVLAEHISGSIDNFADLMNKKAKEIGCQNTHFVNPSGIHDDNHYTTAYDLALIGKYAMQYDTIMNIVKETSYTLPASEQYPNNDRIFVTTNSLVRKSFKDYYYPYATGLKTGYTEYAKDCIVATASKNNIDLIAVILNSEYTEEGLRQKYLDCHTLFNYGFSNYSMKQLTWNSNILQYIDVANAQEGANKLGILPSDNLYAFIKNNASNSNYEPTIVINNNIHAPIKKDDIVGSISYNINGITYSTKLIASSNIEAYNPIGKYIFRILGGFCLLLLFSIIHNITNEKKHKNYKRKNKRKQSNKISYNSINHTNNKRKKSNNNLNNYKFK